MLVAWAAPLVWAQRPASVPTPAPIPAPRPVTSVEGITEYRLPNGLQVLLAPDDSKPTTTVNVTYRVGSRHESYGETGMAHLLEHLVFKGTPTTRNAFAEFTKRGFRANGTTSFDRTNYYASFAANDDNLRWYLGWQADVMVNSLIAKADLDSEMTVVRNEMEAGENNAGGVLFRRALAAMYDWHNYGKATIGARSDVETVDIARLQAFYKRHYQPDNATLIVSGRFNPDVVLGWVVQSFGAVAKPTRLLAPTTTLEAAQDGERSVTVRRQGGAPLIYMAYHLPAAAHPDAAAAMLLAQVLGDEPGGRLHKHLVQTQLASGVFATTLLLAEPGALFLGAVLPPGQDLARVRTHMAAALDGLRAEPVTAAELERARTQWLNQWDKGFNDAENVGVEISSAIAKGDWRLYFLERNRVRSASLEDVQRVANTWLLPDNRTVATYTPVEQAQRAPAPAKVDVAAQLLGFKGDDTGAVAERFEATPANLDQRTQRLRLPSGLQVALLPKGTRGQTVHARLALHVGDLQSLHGQDATLALMGAMLGKGAVGLERQQINDRFDQLRAEVGFAFEGQTLQASISTTRAHINPGTALLLQVLRTAQFNADLLEEVRGQWLTGIEQQRKEPEALASTALARHGNPYRPGDPRYAETFDESEAAIKAVTLEGVRAAYQRFVNASVGEWAAVGDFDAPSLVATLQQGVGDWGASAQAAPYARIPNPVLPASPVRLLLAAPDKQNATLLVHLPLPLNDSHPDYAALTVANFIFGGGGNSRLWQRIREKDGLSYDVRSQLNWSQAEPHSTWVSSAIFAPQNQARVEAAWKEELQRSLQQGFGAAELEEARAGLLSARRLGRSQDLVMTNVLLSNLEHQRRFDVSQHIDDSIARMTLEEVNAVWRKYLVPGQLMVAWAGDFKSK